MRSCGLTGSLCNVYIAQMSTKTISLKKEAYERLRAAKRSPTESFSEVVLRATWPEDTLTASSLLSLYRRRSARFSDDELDRIEAVTRADAPPEDKWAGR
jgi:hypothetical protein